MSEEAAKSCDICGKAFNAGEINVAHESKSAHVMCVPKPLVLTFNVGFFLPRRANAADYRDVMIANAKAFNAYMGQEYIDLSSIDHIVQEDRREQQEKADKVRNMSIVQWFTHYGTKLNSNWLKIAGVPAQELGDTLFERNMFLEAVESDRKHEPKPVMVERLWFASRWVANGSPIFKLTHSLVAALALTDCGDQNVLDIRLPYSAMVVEMPFPQEIVIKPAIDDASSEPARYLFLQRQTSDVLGEAYEKEVTELNKRIHASKEKGDAIVRMKLDHLAKWRKQMPLECFIVGIVGEKTSITTVAEAPLENIKLDEWVDGLTDVSLTADQSNAMRVVLRILVNLTMYLDSIKGAHLEACAQTRRKPGQPNHYTVGREIKLPGQLIQAARALTTEGDAKPVWKVRSRFIVRGHYRMQAHGTARSERKRIWIEPFWKGPDTWELPTEPRVYDAMTITEKGKAH